MKIDAEFVQAALARHAVWDVGNEALYRLCRKHPDHRSIDCIVAKVWLIGRSYAAAIERRRDTTEHNGDEFYTKVVGPRIRDSDIDRWSRPVRELRRPDAAIVVPAHARLTALFEKVSGLEKRSLASKYLHFHSPRAVYIYDERVSRGIRVGTRPQRQRELPFPAFDPVYARFFLRCREFHDRLEQLVGRRFTPREVDKVLLAVADRAE